MDAGVILAAACFALPAGATIALFAAVEQARAIQARPALASLAFRRAS